MSAPHTDDQGRVWSHGDNGAFKPLRPMVEHALAYAKRGWRIFPVWYMKDGRCACGKKDCRKAKHPIGTLAPNGFKDATTDADVIRRWWSAHPDANIGIPTGA